MGWNQWPGPLFGQVWSGIEVTIWSGVVGYRGDCWSGVVGYRGVCLVRSGVVGYRGDCLVRCGRV